MTISFTTIIVPKVNASGFFNTGGIYTLSIFIMLLDDLMDPVSRI